MDFEDLISLTEETLNAVDTMIMPKDEAVSLVNIL